MVQHVVHVGPKGKDVPLRQMEILQDRKVGVEVSRTTEDVPDPLELGFSSGRQETARREAGCGIPGPIGIRRRVAAVGLQDARRRGEKHSKSIHRVPDGIRLARNKPICNREGQALPPEDSAGNLPAACNCLNHLVRELERQLPDVVGRDVVSHIVVRIGVIARQTYRVYQPQNAVV